MSITSAVFVLFAAVTLIVYYIVPKKLQWVVLLAASAVFYLWGGVGSAIYVLVTATTIYAATIWMHRISTEQKAYLKANRDSLSKDEKSALKKKNKEKRKAIMIVTLCLNLGILCVFKYFWFALDQLNSILGLFGAGQLECSLRLIVPLGISFYTFQSIGYLVNIYWESYEPEKNYLKVLLFVSFFPQITQGPISDFDELSKELFSSHSFTYENYSRGFQRMLWGFFKKMVVANTAASMVNEIFANYAAYSGITTLIGAFMYSIQIYADFSGYMDIMCGYCEMLGIRLTENFLRPYFSKSIAEYWRRWHISLGAWFKKYIYYPIGVSGWSRKLAKNSRKRFGKHFADTMPASIALVVTWLATGLWHGASWAYIAWGLVNGLFIIFSLWMEPVYAKWKEKLGINEGKWIWRAFQTIRTFILITFIKVLPEVGTLRDGLGLWRHIFADHSIPHSVYALFPTLGAKSIMIVSVSTAMLFLVSLLQRKTDVREWLASKTALWVRILLFACLLLIVIGFGVPLLDNVKGFMYAQF